MVKDYYLDRQNLEFLINRKIIPYRTVYSKLNSKGGYNEKKKPNFVSKIKHNLRNRKVSFILVTERFHIH